MKKILIGWLAPNGKFHECGFMKHIDKAEELAKYYYNENQSTISDEYLLLKGFAKFTREYVFMCDPSIKVFTFTDAQIKFISESHVTESQKFNISLILDQEDIYRGEKIYKGNENLKEYCNKNKI